METNRKSILGIILIILGSYFLLDNLDIIDIYIPWYFFTWQMILIGIGLFNLLTGNRKAAFILIGIGAFFLLPEFFAFDIRDFWPVILIFIGVSFFLRNRDTSIPKSSDDNSFDDLTVFGSNEKVVTSQQFVGGKSSTIFGSTKIDLRETQFSGNEAVIDSFTMFGSTEVVVPPEWEIESGMTPILGAFEDKRGAGRASAPGAKKLYFKGTVLLGSVEVIN
ncbi:MAG: DUF5668 domain-containing protein [Bacteroidota bacterium]